MADLPPLPIAAGELIPQRGPMRFVDELTRVDGPHEGGEGDEAEVVARIAPGHAMAEEGGTLDNALFLELLAQAYAAFMGYLSKAEGGAAMREGFLVGVRRLEISGQARVGDELVIRVRTAMRMQGFAVAEGEVARGGEVLARGSVKLYDPSGDTEAA